MTDKMSRIMLVALKMLLIRKGIFTREEYEEAERKATELADKIL